MKITTKPSRVHEAKHKNVLIQDITNNPWLYLMVLPTVLFYLIFAYGPMYGLIIAFKNYSPALGIMGSPWAGMHGFEHIVSFVTGPFFGRLMKNTFTISLMSIVLGFPAPIIFALLLNELHNKKFKSVVQSITYIPYFLSMVVVCGLLYTFLGTNGLFNDIIAFFGGERSNLLTRPEYFKIIYVLSDIWQGVGWGSIVYLAALTAIDESLYEAAELDGAGRLRQTIHITIPAIVPTIITLLILRMGTILNVGYEKIILLYNGATMDAADVISSYLYRRGLVNNDYSFSTAVGLFNSVINFVIIWFVNYLSRKYTESGLW